MAAPAAPDTCQPCLCTRTRALREAQPAVLFLRCRQVMLFGAGHPMAHIPHRTRWPHAPAHYLLGALVRAPGLVSDTSFPGGFLWARPGASPWNGRCCPLRPRCAVTPQSIGSPSPRPPSAVLLGGQGAQRTPGNAHAESRVHAPRFAKPKLRKRVSHRPGSLPRAHRAARSSRLLLLHKAGRPAAPSGEGASGSADS